MHMADALISPAVGGVLWAAAAGTAVYAARKIAKDKDNSVIPLMGVAGAFIFAAQMINFSIPLTGSSGHLGGGMLLSILLGPSAAFITMFSVLTVQALFFADGGLLALGSNIFNMAVVPAFFVYPFIYKPLADRFPEYRFASIVFSSLIAVELGAFSVVAETMISGITSLPFMEFAALMLPIHLAIGFVEGAVTALVIAFVYKTAPEYQIKSSSRKGALAKLAGAFLGAAIVAGGFVSYLASENPDGLEWSVAGVTGSSELEAQNGAASAASNIQEKTAFLPDYSFAEGSAADEKIGKAGAGISGIAGAFIVLILSGATGWALVRRKREEN